MSFVPYIHFQGNCAEAMRFYADVFGATDLQIFGYADAPEGAMPGVPTDTDRVMHAALTHPGGVLMGSDFPPGMEGDPQKAVSISFSVGDVAAGKALYDRLLDGGAPIMDYQETFWAEGFGMVRDRFGTHWMISGPGKEPMAG